jgi:hypothetical protein
MAIRHLFQHAADADSVGSVAAKFPSSTTDNAVARYDGSTGTMQDSAFVINDSGHVTTFGGNITFPATAVPSANANTLDDYEEGTFTPTLTFQTPGDLSITYAQQLGTYTKVGRLVTVTWSVVSSAFTHTTASGAVLISGVPFACNATNHFVGSMIAAGITKANYTQFVFRARDSFPNQFEILAQGSGQGSANVVAADMPTGGTVNFRGTITYEV